MNVDVTFETHATSTDNERGIATGWLPGELSAAGREQAVELGSRRVGKVDLVVASDSRRAVQTAEIAFAGTDVTIRHDARLRECDYGVLNGASVAALEAVRRDHIDEPFERGESYRQVVERMRSLLDDLSRERHAGRVLLIGHSATRWALDHLVLGLQLEELVGPFEWRPGWHYRLETRGPDRARLDM